MTTMSVWVLRDGPVIRACSKEANDIFAIAHGLGRGEVVEVPVPPEFVPAPYGMPLPPPEVALPSQGTPDEILAEAKKAIVQSVDEWLAQEFDAQRWGECASRILAGIDPLIERVAIDAAVAAFDRGYDLRFFEGLHGAIEKERFARIRARCVGAAVDLAKKVLGG